MALVLDRALNAENPKRVKPSRFPRLPLYSMFAMLFTAVALIVFGQQTGMGVVKDEMGAPVDMRDIVFVTDSADVIHVDDLQSGQEIASYRSGEGGFVRGAQRALDRMRLVAKAPDGTPYRLILWDSGIISLSDTFTGQRLYLNAFGKDNSAAFAQLLNTYNTTANAAIKK